MRKMTRSYDQILRCVCDSDCIGSDKGRYGNSFEMDRVNWPSSIKGEIFGAKG